MNVTEVDMNADKISVSNSQQLRRNRIFSKPCENSTFFTQMKLFGSISLSTSFSDSHVSQFIKTMRENIQKTFTKISTV